MYCDKCGTYNEEDSIYCRKCGNIINEELLEEEDKKEEKKDKKDKKNKNKNKTKTKVKNKKAKKPKKQKVKEKKVIQNNGEKGMTAFQKFIMFILFILVLGLIGALSYIGYRYYQNMDRVEVPNLIGLTYDEAETVASQYDLELVEKEVETEDESENNIVLDQNKTAGSKVLKGSKIRVEVGFYEQRITISNYVGRDIESVKSELDSLGLTYDITEEYSSEYDNGIVISQNVKEGSSVEEGEEIKLTVCKKDETEEEVSSSEETSSEEVTE